jgi:hypothetical protein
MEPRGWGVLEEEGEEIKDRYLSAVSNLIFGRFKKSRLLQSDTSEK